MKKPGDSNTDVSFGVFVEVFFHLTWRQIFQCSMRPFGIICSFYGFSFSNRKRYHWFAVW
jgi:hypothetical protein